MKISKGFVFFNRSYSQSCISELGVILVWYDKLVLLRFLILSQSMCTSSSKQRHSHSSLIWILFTNLFWKRSFSSFQVNITFLYHQKTSENVEFADVLMGYRNSILARGELQSYFLSWYPIETFHWLFWENDETSKTAVHAKLVIQWTKKPC